MRSKVSFSIAFMTSAFACLALLIDQASTSNYSYKSAPGGFCSALLASSVKFGYLARTLSLFSQSTESMASRILAGKGLAFSQSEWLLPGFAGREGPLSKDHILRFGTRRCIGP